MFVGWFPSGDLRNINYFLQLIPFCTPHSVHFIISPASHNADYYTSRAAILVYDYCLTFLTEVETCWSVGKLNWGLGLFYLNRYLTLFGYVPVMLQFFWSTSNPNKTEVSILLLSSGGGKMLKPTLSDVSSRRSRIVIKSTDYIYSCHHLESYHHYLAVTIQIIVSCRSPTFRTPLWRHWL